MIIGIVVNINWLLNAKLIINDHENNCQQKEKYILEYRLKVADTICIVITWLIFRNNKWLQSIRMNIGKKHYWHDNIPKERNKSKYNNHNQHHNRLWFVIKILLLWEVFLVCLKSFVHHTNDQDITYELEKSAESSYEHNHHHRKVWHIIRIRCLIIVLWFINIIHH